MMESKKQTGYSFVHTGYHNGERVKDVDFCVQ